MAHNQITVTMSPSQARDLCERIKWSLEVRQTWRDPNTDLAAPLTLQIEGDEIADHEPVKFPAESNAAYGERRLAWQMRQRRQVEEIEYAIGKARADDELQRRKSDGTLRPIHPNPVIEHIFRRFEAGLTLPRISAETGMSLPVLERLIVAATPPGLYVPTEQMIANRDDIGAPQDR